ncbi:hypothetical protein ACH5RR_010124 [Cinchona calisaya]|uniref:Uncharacterized protein n=1 Tax=Cinchona calisaya TaxID=153742 RepID=A0ABD3AGC1_9GENT
MGGSKTLCFCIPSYRSNKSKDDEISPTQKSSHSKSHKRHKKKGDNAVVGGADHAAHGSGSGSGSHNAGTNASSTDVSTAAMVVVATHMSEFGGGGCGGSSHGFGGDGGAA